MFNRRRFLRFIVTAAGLSLALLPAQAAQRSLADDARDFGKRHSPRAVSLSPDGTKIVYLIPQTGQSIVARMTDLTSGATRDVVVAAGKPEMLRWCEFAGAQRLVCNYSGIQGKAGDLIGFSRLVSLNPDGSDLKELVDRTALYSGGLVQFDGSVIDWNGGNSPSLLMARVKLERRSRLAGGESPSGKALAVDQIDVRTAAARTVEPARADVFGYMSGGHGDVRMMFESERASNGLLTGKVIQFYRKPGSREWLRFGTTKIGADGGFDPQGIDPKTGDLFALRKKDGRAALYRVKLDGSMASELVASHPRVDIDGIVRLGRGHAIVGYSYVEDRQHIEYFDPQVRSMTAAFARAVPELPLLTIVDVSTDGGKVLFFAASDSDPGRYFLHDRTTRQMREIAIARPELTGRDFARVKAVRYPAKDGKMVPAYVTLPPGSSGRGLPAVVLPHGGPSARDEWGFDWIAQFLAARGYAVIQPNFRGSAGYGKEWLADNAIKNWKLAISDISDAGQYLVTEKIADPARMAILGWSYGGYAALQSVAIEPARYKAAIAIAPVTDLALLKSDASGFTNSRLVDDFVGSGRHIVDGAPLRNVAAIQVPVLLVHGDLDANVGIAHADRMAAALRKTGKLAGYLRYKGLDHQLEDSAVREEMLTRTAKLLEQTIGH